MPEAGTMKFPAALASGVRLLSHVQFRKNTKKFTSLRNRTHGVPHFDSTALTTALNLLAVTFSKRHAIQSECIHYFSGTTLATPSGIDDRHRRLVPGDGDVGQLPGIL